MSNINAPSNRSATQKEYDEAVEIYNSEGQYGVYRYAESNGITSWSLCEPCEDETPDCANGACLVCGSMKEGK